MRGVVVVGCGALLMATAAMLPAGQRHRAAVEEDGVRVEGDGLEQTLHCHRNAIHIVGNKSRLVIDGSCAKVYVEGSYNWIEIEDADVIEMRGDMNSVLYLNPGTRTVDRGRANSVAPKWQQ